MQCHILTDVGIESIFWPGSGSGLTVGIGGVKTMQTIPVAGQGGHVPWVEVAMEDGAYYRYNAAYLEGIKYRQEARDDGTETGK